ncbi:hypothetical protein CULC22_00052 [Corynebacterium ulcerans BR-AD22]|uniref:Uncharacterized protein n=1 Tax=Corynebacterium ulcerans FRC58 TaxID=1408268 RepID=A0ABN4GVX7_CORUL|nr:hypothetical protein CULC22_00052 [Corynebacterium ulcerans BR-AD22]AIU90663.1 Hypothetical protein Cul05146_0058 [Corynebacterium ulcerans]AKN75907.1 Hypothetical protein CulFRC58_0053 [Corynebacterium ulcerans FRC58]
MIGFSGKNRIGSIGTGSWLRGVDDEAQPGLDLAAGRDDFLDLFGAAVDLLSQAGTTTDD